MAVATDRDAPLKVLHVSSSYPLTEGDTTAPFMEEMMVALVEAGHQVTMVVPRVVDLAEGERNGVRLVGAPYAPSRFQDWGYSRSLDENGRIKTSAKTLTPVAMASMIRVVRRELAHSPDLIHLHWLVPQGVIALAVPKTLPVVVSVHGADAKFAGGRLRPIVDRIVGRADALVAASSKILGSVASIHSGATSKAAVIPHGANPKLFKPRDRAIAKAELGLAPDRRLVLGVGRLVKKKGFAELVKAVLPLGDSVELAILGEGPERPALLNLNQQVRLVGATPRKEVAVWLAAADVVVIPSIEVAGDIDSGPVVLMEAMAAGRRVVSTRVGMAPDVIEDGVNGYLVNSAEPGSLSSGISRALSHGDQLDIGAARTFEQMGDWSRVAAQLEGIYRSITRSTS